MSETKTFVEFKEKFRVDEFKILEKGAWSWSVRPAQPTLGSGILSLNRYALHLSEVTPEEMADLGELIGQLEKTVKTIFDYNIMNYFCSVFYFQYGFIHCCSHEEILDGTTVSCTQQNTALPNETKSHCCSSTAIA